MIPASRNKQVVSIFLCYAVAGVFWGSYVAAMPALKDTSGLSDAGFGALITATTIGGIVAMQGLGRVLHRVQAWAIPACLVAMGTAQALIGLAQGPIVLWLALLLTGAASGALDISLNMRVARIEADFGLRLFNRVHALVPFSMLLASAAVGLLREAGATPAMLFPPVILAFVAAAAFERQAGRHQLPDHRGEKAGSFPMSSILILLGVLAGFGAVLEGGSHTWSAIYVEEGLGAGAALAGFASAAITLGLTTGRLIAHSLEHKMRDMAILRIFALISAPAFVALSLLPFPYAALAAFFVAGIGIGPIEPAVFRSVARRFDEAERGKALARATALAYGGYLAAPPVLGQIISGFGFAGGWAVLAALALCAAGLTLRVPPAAHTSVS